VHDVILFEDIGNGQTKLTFIGNETMEDARNSGQLEGWNQILEKVAAVIAGLAKAEIRSWRFDDRPARDIAKAGGGSFVRTGFSPLGRIASFPAQ
jgi:hypothetical protein